MENENHRQCKHASTTTLQALPERIAISVSSKTTERVRCIFFRTAIWLIIPISYGLSGCAGTRPRGASSGFSPDATLDIVAVIDDGALRRASASPASRGEAEPLLAAPVSISLSSTPRAGSLIIADQQTGRILNISETNALVNDAVLSGSGTANSSRYPRQIRLDFGGALYLCDGVSSHAMTYDARFRRMGDLVPPYEALAIVEGAITGLALGAFGEIYLVDATNGRVYRFDASGRYVSSFRGEENGWARLSRPAGAVCATNDGSVYVCDPGRGRVVVFDNSGQPLRSFGEGDLLEPVAVALDGRGQAYIADTKAKAISVFNSSGRLVGRIDAESLPSALLAGPTDVAVADSLLYIADPPSGRVLKILMRDTSR